MSTAAAARNFDPEAQRLRDAEEKVRDVSRAFSEAVGRLAEDEAVGADAVDRLIGTDDRLRKIEASLDDLPLDSAQLRVCSDALEDIARARSDSDLGEFDRLERYLLGVERIRHVLRDAVDEFVGGHNASPRKLLAVIDLELSGSDAKQADVAGLLGVSTRTLSRWKHEKRRDTPTARLWIVARLVRILGHALTPRGILMWFAHEREALGGRSPRQWLDEDRSQDRLLALARQARNQYVS